MIIILEGLDKAGKSTFAKKFKERYKDVDYMYTKENSPALSELHYYVMWDDEKSITIFDRTIISEYCYGTVYRETSKFSKEQIIEELTEIKDKIIILYFNRNLSACEFDKEDKYENNIVKLMETGRLYDEIMHELAEAGVPVYRINYEV